MITSKPILLKLERSYFKFIKYDIYCDTHSKLRDRGFPILYKTYSYYNYYYTFTYRRRRFRGLALWCSIARLGSYGANPCGVLDKSGW